jgi:hypothetical protein
VKLSEFEFDCAGVSIIILNVLQMAPEHRDLILDILETADQGSQFSFLPGRWANLSAERAG